MRRLWLCSLYPLLLQLSISLLEITGLFTVQSLVLGMLPEENQGCCNGILGYAVPDSTMPCADMRCCNKDETVALQEVNHALGFCFRCVPQYMLQQQSISETRCYTNGESVASTDNTTIEYRLRTCCSGLRFAVVTYTNDVAMTIKCVQR